MCDKRFHDYFSPFENYVFLFQFQADSHGVHFHCYEKFRYYENWLHNYYVIQSCHSFQIGSNEQDIIGFSERFMGNIHFWTVYGKYTFLVGWFWKRLRERGSEEGIQTSDSRSRFQFQNGISCEEKWFTFLIERYSGTTLYKLGQR